MKKSPSCRTDPNTASVVPPNDDPLAVPSGWCENVAHCLMKRRVTEVMRVAVSLYGPGAWTRGARRGQAGSTPGASDIMWWVWNSSSIPHISWSVTRTPPSTWFWWFPSRRSAWSVLGVTHFLNDWKTRYVYLFSYIRGICPPQTDILNLCEFYLFFSTEKKRCKYCTNTV